MLGLQQLLPFIWVFIVIEIKARNNLFYFIWFHKTRWRTAHTTWFSQICNQYCNSQFYAVLRGTPGMHLFKKYVFTHLESGTSSMSFGGAWATHIKLKSRDCAVTQMCVLMWPWWAIMSPTSILSCWKEISLTFSPSPKLLKEGSHKRTVLITSFIYPYLKCDKI